MAETLGQGSENQLAEESSPLNESSSKDKNWWQGGVIYQIYPRSYQDSNGDGVGDLPGILKRLDYVASLGVDAIWLSPFFRSPMKDYGYDVSDYRDVDPLFGCLDDFRAVIEKAHELGIKIIIDQVLNHCSDQHEWFKESRQSQDNEKANWFVWANAKPDGSPPNNWLSVFGGSAWNWEARRGQYYLHNFLESQPDLNFHYPEVRQQMLDDIEFWLKLGVDGLRLDACNFYFHDALLRDNPPVDKDEEKTKAVTEANPYTYQKHVYDICQPETIDFHEEIRALLDRYPGTTSIGEIGADEALDVMAQYMAGGNKLFMAYTFDLLTTKFEPSEIRRIVSRVETQLQEGWPCWSFSNHDVVRAVSRMPKPHSPAQAHILLGLLGSLRGSLGVYQGEELGLPEADIPYEKLQDPYGLAFWPEFKGRDGCRTPMPWEHKKEQAGFSDVEPWLPVPETHKALSVDLQDETENSALAFYRNFFKWRQGYPALKKGSFSWLDFKDPQGLLFKRSYQGESVLVALNLSPKPLTFELTEVDGLDESTDFHVSPIDGHGFTGTWDSETRTVHLAPWQAFFGLFYGA